MTRHLVIGKGGVEARELVDALLRADSRGRWLADPSTRNRVRLDWSTVGRGELLERLLIAEVSEEPLVSVRMSPAPAKMNWYWGVGEPDVRSELEGMLEQAVGKTVQGVIDRLDVRTYLGVQVLHTMHQVEQRPELHAHVLMLDTVRAQELLAYSWQGAGAN